MNKPTEHWMNNSTYVRRIYLGLWIFGAMWVVPDLFLHKHEEVEFATTPGFYAIFGFIACVVLVLLAKGLRRLLMRPENYYEP